MRMGLFSAGAWQKSGLRGGNEGGGTNDTSFFYNYLCRYFYSFVYCGLGYSFKSYEAGSMANLPHGGTERPEG